VQCRNSRPEVSSDALKGSERDLPLFFEPLICADGQLRALRRFPLRFPISCKPQSPNDVPDMPVKVSNTWNNW